MSSLLPSVARAKLSALPWLRRDGKHVVRTLLALEAAWWGFDLALPWATFPMSPVYRLMAAWAPEWVWALLFLVSAALYVYGFGGGRLRRIGTAGLGGILHAVVVTSALVSAPESTATGTHTIWLLATYLLIEWEAMDD